MEPVPGIGRFEYSLATAVGLAPAAGKASLPSHPCAEHSAGLAKRSFKLHRASCSWFIHSLVCLMTGPPPLPKPVLHTVQSSGFTFSFLYLHFSLRSSSSCLCPLPHPSVTSIFPSIFLRRQFLRQMWPIQLAFLHFIHSYQSADKSLAQPGRKQATATKL
jgi:hypothetical protein